MSLFFSPTNSLPNLLQLSLSLSGSTLLLVTCGRRDAHLNNTPVVWEKKELLQFNRKLILPYLDKLLPVSRDKI